MQNDNSKHEHHVTGYGTYILVWLALIALTSITVTVSGIDFGMAALGIALFIAAIKSALVINIFMHIKFDEAIFKVFLLVSLFTLLVIFILTFFDVVNR
ncbi:MAG: cytochrome C oxidase subunit IV family protein [Melioribacteraceae bacterium]|nr:cytochrome C oxidase subunit IV family protein [Melioribacteraceae bacterium]MCF8354413.1 cytochrome C oxidase subunit IV family protein [Melioribacteraceae bacterium]MCF8392990.1 cytochrome C oxidase subunit IV family protein [Melioribacteraceae bacterium]MCF8417267.1 cytochrome C oxidase subunit IV family protein [Melioribacteraceae bacterium]